LKIGFVCSEKYSRYDKLIKEIVDSVNKRLVKEGQAVETSQIILGTRKKYDLYIFITDDIDDFNFSYSKIKPKSKPILITQNLEDKYIRAVIGFVTDIIYGKNNVEVIANRIISIIGKIYA